MISEVSLFWRENSMFFYKVETRPDVLLLDLHWGFFDVHTTKDVRSTIFHQGLSGVAGGRVAEVLDCDQKGPRFQPTTSRPFFPLPALPQILKMFYVYLDSRQHPSILA